MASSYEPYTVKPGDILDTIARAHGTNYIDLAKLNGIPDPNYIVPGQVIKFAEDTSTDTGPTITPYISGVSDGTQTALEMYETGYTPSDSVNTAYSNLQDVTKPGEYASRYDEAIQKLYENIVNNTDFKYDLNGDALYNQYKSQYTSLGQLAMQDTMGQAAAMTGGYGSSYASTAGNQAYQSYLQQLNNVVPDLYSQAYQQHQGKLSNMYNQYSLLADMDATDYSQYRDSMSDYYNNLSLATNAYNTERDFDYSKWADMLSYYLNKSESENEDYWYKKDWDYRTK